MQVEERWLIKNAGSIAYKQTVRDHKKMGACGDHIKLLGVASSDVANIVEKAILDSLQAMVGHDAE